MNPVTIGAVTIGQSPRDDVIPVIQDLLQDIDLEVSQCGALDGLSVQEITAEAPTQKQGVLVTRMRDGTPVKVNREFLVPRIKQCIHSLEDTNDFILMLCTDPFCGLDSRKLLLAPGRILLKTVDALGVRRIGVLTPAEEQRREQEDKWAKVAQAVMVSAVSPYTESHRVGVAGETLGRAGVDLIVMDCIGYTPAMRQAVRSVAGCPVLLPTTTLAGVVKELLRGRH